MLRPARLVLLTLALGVLSIPLTARADCPPNITPDGDLAQLPEINALTTRDALDNALESRRAELKRESFLCQDWFPSKLRDGECDAGDTLLFNALLCLSGETLGCTAVKASQAEDGHVWRSPLHIATAGNPDFSRDMTLGGLVYLVATHDTDFAERWLRWIESNKHSYDICKVTSGDLPLDSACILTPPVWDLFDLVWRTLGLEPNEEMRADSLLMDFLGREAVGVASVRTTTKGYEWHLKAAQLILYRAAGLGEMPALATALVEKSPKNLLFRWLKEGPTDALKRAILLRYPPRPEPRLLRTWLHEVDQVKLERPEGDACYPWQESMGWDGVALIGLLDVYLPLQEAPRDCAVVRVGRTIAPSVCSSEVRALETVALAASVPTPCTLDQIVDATCHGLRDVVESKVEKYACTVPRRVRKPVQHVVKEACDIVKQVPKTVDDICHRTEETEEKICDTPFLQEICKLVRKTHDVTFPCKATKMVDEIVHTTCDKTQEVLTWVDEQVASVCSRVVEKTFKQPFDYACKVVQKVPSLCPRMLRQWQDKVVNLVEDSLCSIEKEAYTLANVECRMVVAPDYRLLRSGGYSLALASEESATDPAPIAASIGPQVAFSEADLSRWQSDLGRGVSANDVRREMVASAPTRGVVMAIYHGILGRWPTGAELSGAVERLRQGRTLKTLAHELAYGREAAQKLDAQLAGQLGRLPLPQELRRLQEALARRGG